MKTKEKKVVVAKQVEPVPVVEPVAPVEPVVQPEVKHGQESEAKAKYRAIIEDYKKSNPKKYEMKKVELENKLNALK